MSLTQLTPLPHLPSDWASVDALREYDLNRLDLRVRQDPFIMEDLRHTLLFTISWAKWLQQEVCEQEDEREREATTREEELEAELGAEQRKLQRAEEKLAQAEAALEEAGKMAVELTAYLRGAAG